MNISNRLSKINLHIHSYSFILNFKHGDFDVIDLLDFASKEELNGIDIDISDGGDNSLRNKSKKELETVKLHAQKLGLEIDLDISSTSKNDVDRVVYIAKILGVRRIRLYARYHGQLSKIITRMIKDLKLVARLAEINDLQFLLEQHEILKSEEMIKIIKAVNSPRVSLLFDFGNMINANERPLAALKNSLPYIRKVHIRDVYRIKKNKGYEQVGAYWGEGDIPQIKMLLKLLLLGKSEPQVQVYSIQQVIGYHSPPYRFDDESENPIMPSRGPSDTALDETKDLKNNLSLEVENVSSQVAYIKECFKSIKRADLVKSSPHKK